MHTAPVEIREKLAIAEADWPNAIGELCAFPHIEEAAVLSTCNRMEVYIVALSYNRGVREVEEFLARVRAALGPIDVDARAATAPPGRR